MNSINFQLTDEIYSGPVNPIIHPVNVDGVIGSLPTLEEFCNNAINKDIILDVLSQLPEPAEKQIADQQLPSIEFDTTQPELSLERIDVNHNQIDEASSIYLSTGEQQATNPAEVSETTEKEIDEALLRVLNSFQTANKRILDDLDEDTLQKCLDYVRKSPVLICSSCLVVFQHIPSFQVHIQTCCSPPRTEIQPKLDHTAMDLLARSLWKQVFLKQFHSLPANRVFHQYEDQLLIELDVLWKDCPMDAMLNCREIFIRAAAAIASQKWVSIAVANELYRTRKLRLSKLRKALPASATPIEAESLPKRKRERKSSQKKISQVEHAIKSISENNHLGIGGGYHITPETPVSDCGIDLTLEMEEIDRFVREGQTDDEDLVAAAAKQFEDFEPSISGDWNSQDTETLGENEYLVSKILNRRLVFNVCRPTDSDYEYLVEWEGYGPKDNTWEPYDNLKSCSDLMNQFLDRIRTKALRRRKGKR